MMYRVDYRNNWICDYARPMPEASRQHVIRGAQVNGEDPDLVYYAACGKAWYRPEVGAEAETRKETE